MFYETIDGKRFDGEFYYEHSELYKDCSNIIDCEDIECEGCPEHKIIKKPIMTVCTLTSSNECTVGIAICSTKDNPRKSEGRRIAKERAIYAIEYKNMTDLDVKDNPNKIIKGRFFRDSFDVLNTHIDFPNYWSYYNPVNQDEHSDLYNIHAFGDFITEILERRFQRKGNYALKQILGDAN